MRKFRVLLLASLLVTSVGLFVPNARAEASDAERRTARDLFLAAYKIQQAGRFGEALEKYEKSLSLFQAPTTLYRIGQCQSALGKWVEAAESYRAAEATPLAANASAAFKEAQSNAATERATLEARTPTLTVDVTPHEGPSITWAIDGEPFKTGLLGTAIKLNPGSRRIQVSAPGYESTEQLVALKERETQTVRIALAPQASLPVVPPVPPVVPVVPVVPVPTGELPPSQEDLPPPPSRRSETKPEPVSTSKLTRSGLIIGIRGGAMHLNGGPTLARAGEGSALFGGFGALVAGDVGFRFSNVVVLSAYLDYGVLRGPEAGALERAAGQRVTFTTNATTIGVGFLLSLIANPVRPSLYFELGVGSRQTMLTVSRYDSDSGTNTDYDYKFTGPEATVGMGLWIPAGRSFALLPKVSFMAGVLNKLDCTSTAACPVDESFLGSGDIWKKAAHTTLTLNLAGFYTLSF